MIKEPLPRLATLARDLSRDHCHPGDIEEGGCAWYHSLIEYLRLIDVVATPATHHDFFVAQIVDFAAKETLGRILVSGAADCSMLVQVQAGIEAVGASPDIVMIDRCGTPVQLNRWFAERESIPLQTYTADIRDFTPDHPFDLICTHCILGYFSPVERVRIAEKWHDALRPGGKVLTVTPVRPVESPDPIGFNSEQAAAFRKRALDALARHAPLPGLERDRFDSMLKDYTDQLAMYPVRSEAEIIDFFGAGGLSVESVLGADGAPLPTGAGMGPTETGVAYATVIARRD